MLTVSPHLHTRRPSPTTIEYTVSTNPPSTLPLRALLAASFALRLLLGVSALLLLFSLWQQTEYAMALPRASSAPSAHIFSSDYLWHALAVVHSTPLGRAFSTLATMLAAPALALLCFGLLYATVLRVHTHESLLVLRGLGIQTSSSGATYLASATTRFIPTDKIQDIFVNEAFRGFEVRYYLVVVVEGEQDVVVVFPKLLPRRKIVERVWRGIRGCLYEPEREKESPSI